MVHVMSCLKIMTIDLSMSQLNKDYARMSGYRKFNASLLDEKDFQN